MVALFSFKEFTHTISVVRTVLLRERVIVLFAFEYADVFNVLHITPHFLPTVFSFMKIHSMRFWLEFYFSRQTFYTECCLSKPLLFTGSDFQHILLSTSMRKLGNMNRQLNLSYGDLRAP